MKPQILNPPTMRMTEWFLLFILSLLWGGSFFLVKIALQDFPPLTVVFCRVGLAAVLLNFYVYLSGQRMPIEVRVWGAFLLMGLLNNLIPFSLIVWGQTQIDSGLASILNATTPIFTVLLGHFFTDNERLTSKRLWGVMLGFGGVVVLLSPEVGQGWEVQGWGQLAVVGATFSYGCAGIYGRRFKDLSPVLTATGMLTCSTVMMLPLALIVEGVEKIKPSLMGWGAVLGLGLFSTAMPAAVREATIAYLIYFRILAQAGATNVMLVTFLMPISALLLGVFVLGEQLNFTTFAGMATIFTGLAAIDGRLISIIWRRYLLR